MDQCHTWTGITEGPVSHKGHITEGPVSHKASITEGPVSHKGRYHTGRCGLKLMARIAAAAPGASLCSLHVQYSANWCQTGASPVPTEPQIWSTSTMPTGTKLVPHQYQLNHRSGPPVQCQLVPNWCLTSTNWYHRSGPPAQCYGYQTGALPVPTGSTDQVHQYSAN